MASANTHLVCIISGIDLKYDVKFIITGYASRVGRRHRIHRAVSGARADGVGWGSELSVDRWSLLWAVGPRPRGLEHQAYQAKSISCFAFIDACECVCVFQDVSL